MQLTTHMGFLQEKISFPGCFPFPEGFQRPPGPFSPAFSLRTMADPTLPAQRSALQPHHHLPVLRPFRSSLVRRGRRGQRVSPSLLLFTLALPLGIPLSAQDGVLRSRSLVLVAGRLSPTVSCWGKTGKKGENDYNSEYFQLSPPAVSVASVI